MITSILVALDGSKRAPAVLDAAAEIAARFRATLHPFRAIEVPPEFPPAAAWGHPDELAAHDEAVARQQLIELARRHPEVDVANAVIAIAPQAWRAIVRASEEVDVDLIVLGSHGYHGLDRVLGTTAAKVANLARRNVLVVHNRAPTPPGMPSKVY